MKEPVVWRELLAEAPWPSETSGTKKFLFASAEDKRSSLPLLPPIPKKKPPQPLNPPIFQRHLKSEFTRTHKTWKWKKFLPAFLFVENEGRKQGVSEGQGNFRASFTARLWDRKKLPGEKKLPVKNLHKNPTHLWIVRNWLKHSHPADAATRHSRNVFWERGTGEAHLASPGSAGDAFFWL